MLLLLLLIFSQTFKHFFGSDCYIAVVKIFTDLEFFPEKHLELWPSPRSLRSPWVTLRKRGVFAQEMILLSSCHDPLGLPGSDWGISMENTGFSFPTLFIIWWCGEQGLHLQGSPLTSLSECCAEMLAGLFQVCRLCQSLSAWVAVGLSDHFLHFSMAILSLFMGSWPGFYSTW